MLDGAAMAVRLEMLGRIPKPLRDLEAWIEDQQKDMETAVAEGDFEKAANICDQQDKVRPMLAAGLRETDKVHGGALGGADAPAGPREAQRRI
jgi:hypothetical protein